MKIVLRPVAMDSADSRVVALTDVNRAISSFKSPPAALKTPPVRRITEIRSPASTANCPATALIAPSWPSRADAPWPNWLNIAIAPSAVFAISSKVGARLDLANASNATFVSYAVRPA